MTWGIWQCGEMMNVRVSGEVGEEEGDGDSEGGLCDRAF